MSADLGTLHAQPSPWPHRLALLLCCATFPLVWVGGLVTTYQAGMAVPDWPNTYGYNLFLYPLSTWISGPWNLFVEHGHRLFASLIGLLTIAFCVAVWRTCQPRWLRVLGAIALLAIVGQGVLGGIRVLMDERTLAKIHGCVGPAFFAFTAVLVVVTSKRWHAATSPGGRVSSLSFSALALTTPVLAYLQIVLGAQLRHFAPDGSPDVFRLFLLAHIVCAVALALQILATSYSCWRQSPRIKGLLIPATLLVGLIIFQLTLGAATWIVKYGPPAFLASSDFAATFTVQEQSIWQAQITTAHVATGSLILAIATVLATRAAGINWSKITGHNASAWEDGNRVSSEAPASSPVHRFTHSPLHGSAA